MDGNKDEALKCLRICREALEAGDRTRALKFVTKARRLDPTLLVDDLLSAIEGQSADQSAAPAGESSSQASTKPSEQSSVRHRVSAGGSSTSTSSVAYTEEQITIVRQIKKKKDYYEILGLEKTCTVDDVRKAYRKLSLKVHPDKNKAPGAEEAFKAVSKAFQCLSNEESRKRYDLVGSDEPVLERRTTRHNPHGYNGFYDAEIDPDEIFRNFFFGGMHPATAQFGGFGFGRGTGPRMGDHGSGGFNLRTLIQLLPVLVLLLLNFLPSSEPIYALSRKYPYEYRFVTQKGVNYYVKTANFEQQYPPNTQERVALERRVESDYFSILAQNCQLELQRKHWGFIQETPHCDMLRQYESVA
ncbi:chaperone protein dnaJ 49-like [Malania oleifera]|uniref:chaperone protein dnaJ 49-like n=1 Tax=Malania oleifera TaxID=397392 RepID=UPI0025AEB3D7|nr:chaperone protein dnaJ 49-like [Malania oleifera]